MLAILATLIAIAFPEFVKLYTRVRVSFEREDLERQLLALPQKARDAGRGGILMDPSGDQAAGTAGEAGQTTDTGFEQPEPLRLDLPQGWSLRVQKPVFYHFTGACDGGEVILSLPPLTLRYVLAAPLCRPLLANAQ